MPFFNHATDSIHHYSRADDPVSSLQVDEHLTLYVSVKDKCVTGAAIANATAVITALQPGEKMQCACGQTALHSHMIDGSVTYLCPVCESNFAAVLRGRANRLKFDTNGSVSSTPVMQAPDDYRGPAHLRPQRVPQRIESEDFEPEDDRPIFGHDPDEEREPIEMTPARQRTVEKIAAKAEHMMRTRAGIVPQSTQPEPTPTVEPSEGVQLAPPNFG